MISVFSLLLPFMLMLSGSHTPINTPANITISPKPLLENFSKSAPEKSIPEPGNKNISRRLSFFKTKMRLADRFTSVDPIINKEEALVNPQLWNLYTYCGNNPITYFDPDGRLRRNKKTGKLKFWKTGKPITITHGGDPTSPNTVQPGYLKADDGNKIRAFKNLSKDKRFDTDCHGETFADGEYWINNSEVNKILKGDKYKNRTSPTKGDIVVYYDNSGKVVHTATVFDVDKSGNVTVEGLGGLESKTHKDDVNKAWSDPNKKIKYFKK